MKTRKHAAYDFVVIGGGLAGICAAVTAARQGSAPPWCRTVRCSGGNASTEIRVPPVGASQCNFAYSRETGLIEELFLNNLHRNPTWCPEGWNLELETLVRNEPNARPLPQLRGLRGGHGSAGWRTGSEHASRPTARSTETWHRVRGPLFCRLLRRRRGRLAGGRGVPHGRGGAFRIRRTDVPRRGRPATRWA